MAEQYAGMAERCMKMAEEERPSEKWEVQFRKRAEEARSFCWGVAEERSQTGPEPSQPRKRADLPSLLEVCSQAEDSTRSLYPH